MDDLKKNEKRRSEEWKMVTNRVRSRMINISTLQSSDHKCSSLQLKDEKEGEKEREKRFLIPTQPMTMGIYMCMYHLTMVTT